MKKLLLLLLLPCWLQAQQTTPISLEKSVLNWEGKPLVGTGHTGTIQFKSGFIATNESGKITGGEFVLDMLTIKNTDIKEENSARDLETHLGSDDFFSVEKFPLASFTIISALPSLLFPDQDLYMVKGMVTIKGISHAISFPAKIVRKNGILETTAKFSIDRTKWGIQYQSPSVLSTVQDGLISDEITINLQLIFDTANRC